MTTLVDTVRLKAGNPTTSEVTDARIIDALNDTSVRLNAAPLEWVQDDPTSDRTGRLAIGAYQVEASADEGGSNAQSRITLWDGNNVVIDSTDWTVTRDGYITLTDATVEKLSYYATGKAYDVHAAAAVIVEQMLAAAARDYDFKRGDQSFSRSQVVEGLTALLGELRAKAIPRRRGERVMRDQSEPRTRWGERRWVR